jgi:hypothetical protein
MRHAAIAILGLLALAPATGHAQQAPAVAAPPAAEAAPPAEMWIYAGMKGGAMGWEVTSAWRDPARDTAYIPRFVYYRTPQTQQAIAYQVIVQKFEFECGKKRFLLGEGLYFNDKLEEVAASMPETAWADVPDGTPEAILMQVACEGAEVSGQKAAGNLLDAVTDARTLAIP